MAYTCLLGLALRLDAGLEPAVKHAERVRVDQSTSLGRLVELAVKSFTEPKSVGDSRPLAALPVLDMFVARSIKVTSEVSEVIEVGVVIREFHVIILS